MKHTNKITYILLVFIASLLSFFAGMYLTDSRKEHEGFEDSALFTQVRAILDKDFALEQPSDQKREFGVIKGYVNSFEDDHTRFFDTEEAEVFNQDSQGEFAGIGVEIAIENGALVIVAPIKDSPAETVGLEAGDRIISVDGEDVLDMYFDELVSKIRGPLGSFVNLGISRAGKDIYFNIERKTIEIPTIEYAEYDDYFMIKIFSFNEKSAFLFKEALGKFKNSSKKALMLDVRSNPGGYLDAAIDITSHFVPKGDVILIEEKMRSGKDKKFRSKGSEYSFSDNEIIILQDSGSASASEILAGALQDYGIASVVGEKSYGKGSVQELVELKKDTALKLTVALWLTPLRNRINKEGVSPDLEFNFESLDDEKDFYKEIKKLQ